MSSLVNVVHLAGALIGFWLIAQCDKRLAAPRLFWGAAAAICAAAALVLVYLSVPRAWFEDFFTAYLPAGRAVLRAPDALAPLLELGTNGFVNLPLLAYLFAPLALLPDCPAALLFFALGAAALVGTWRLLAARLSLSRRDSAWLLFALCSFGPILYSVKEGNTSHLLLFVLVWGAGLARARRDFSAGAAFAAAALVKPPLLIVGVYYALRGRWCIVAAGALVCAAAGALSLTVFGAEMHALWIEEFRAYSGAPMAAFNAQSFASLLARFEQGLPAYAEWSVHPLSPMSVTLNAGFVLLVAAAAVWASALAKSRWPAAEAEELELWIVLALLCIVSTVSWSHYYAWLAPGLAFLFAHLRAAAPAWLWFVAAYVLTTPVEISSKLVQRGVFGPFSNLVTSHLFIGGLIAAILLLLVRAGRAGPAASR